jgi:hypothetical protein
VYRINLVGLVRVAVTGPVRNLDMLCVDLDCPGKATAIVPRGRSRCVIGQVLDPVAVSDDGSELQTVRCMISPQGKIDPSVTTRMTKTLGDSLRHAKGGVDADALQAMARERVDALKAAESKRQDPATPRTQLSYRLASSVDECDECVVTLVSHATGKALRTLPGSEVDALGSYGAAASQFSLHCVNGCADAIQLQSIKGDDAWLGLDESGVLCVSTDASDPTCVLSVRPSSVKPGAFELIRAGVVAKLADSDGGEPASFSFSLYRREAIIVPAKPCDVEATTAELAACSIAQPTVACA